MTSTDSHQGLSSEGLPDELRLGEPVTDATHAEFLQLLDLVERMIASSEDAVRLQAYLAKGPAAKIVPYPRLRSSRKP